MCESGDHRSVCYDAVFVQSLFCDQVGRVEISLLRVGVLWKQNTKFGVGIKHCCLVG